MKSYNPIIRTMCASVPKLYCTNPSSQCYLFQWMGAHTVVSQSEPSICTRCMIKVMITSPSFFFFFLATQENIARWNDDFYSKEMTVHCPMMLIFSHVKGCIAFDLIEREIMWGRWICHCQDDRLLEIPLVSRSESSGKKLWEVVALSINTYSNPISIP